MVPYGSRNLFHSAGSVAATTSQLSSFVFGTAVAIATNGKVNRPYGRE